MEFWTETRPRARKVRKCDACGQEIQAGQTYAYMAGKFDGEFFTVSQHDECRAAENALAQEHGLHGGEDWIHLNDLNEPDDLLWLREHHPAAFERICGAYSHWLETDADAMLASRTPIEKE